MAYNEKTADRIRKALAGTKKLADKKMFGGIAFMVNDMMCMGVDKDDIVIRCEPERNDEMLARKGARPFDITGKPMKGWILVSEEGTKSKADFDFWVNAALEGNKKAKPAKKK